MPSQVRKIETCGNHAHWLVRNPLDVATRVAFWRFLIGFATCANGRTLAGDLFSKTEVPVICNSAVFPSRYARLALVAACLLIAFFGNGCRRNLAVLTVSAKSVTFKTGTPISIDSDLHNVSGKEIEELASIEVQSDTLFDCPVDMRDEAGSPVPETALGAKKNGHSSLTGTVVSFAIRLAPKTSITGPVQVSQLFDVQKPGKYTIQESCLVSDESSQSSPSVDSENPNPHPVKGTTVKSNVLQIAIVD